MITLAILFAMLLLMIAFALFLWVLIHFSKKYGEKLNALRLSSTIPDEFVLKSSKGTFVMAIINLTLFVGAGWIFGFILSSGQASVTLSAEFFAGATILGAVVLFEILGSVFALVGFAGRKLQVDGQQLRYRDWCGHTVNFQASDIRCCRKFGVGMMPVDFLRFTDSKGKKRFACIYLSEYSRILLCKYIAEHAVYKRVS